MTGRAGPARRLFAAVIATGAAVAPVAFGPPAAATGGAGGGPAGSAGHLLAHAQPAHAQPAHAQAAQAQPAQAGSAVARPAGVPAGRGQAQVAVIVESVGPAAVRPDSRVVLTGLLRNPTPQARQQVSVRLRYSPVPLGSRGQIAQYAAGSPAVGDVALAGSERAVARVLGAGDSRRWRLEIPAERLGFGGFGVYPVAVEAVDGLGRSVAVQRTFLTYWPATGPRPAPTEVSWLWPLVDRPHRGVDTVFTDRALERDLAPGGRLAALLAAGAEYAEDTLLTWVVDPALLDDAQAMGRGYTVTAGSGTTRVPASQTTASWLGGLRTATRTAPVFALPYADPDVTALTRAGLDPDIRAAATAGSAATAQVLGRRIDGTSLAWPPGGTVDRDTLDGLVQAGARTVLLDEAAMPVQPPAPFTADAVAGVPTGVGRRVKVLLADRTLQQVLGSDTRAPGRAAVATQRFLAETAMITAELPATTRTVVVAPPRRWSPGADFAADVLAATAMAPWLKPVQLSRVTAHRSAINPVTGEPVTRGGPVHSAEARKAEVGRPHLTRVAALRSDIATFTSILTPRRTGFDRSVLRLESSAWRERRERGRALRAEVAQALDTERDRIRILNSTVTLSGTEGIGPITIANDLSQYAITVSLRVSVPTNARLAVGELPDRIRVNPRGKETIKLPLRARANGISRVRLLLVNSRGEPITDPVTLEVNVTGYGATAMWITGVGLGVLLLAIAVRVVRRGLLGQPGGPGAAGQAAVEGPEETEPYPPEAVRGIDGGWRRDPARDLQDGEPPDPPADSTAGPRGGPAGVGVPDQQLNMSRSEER